MVEKKSINEPSPTETTGSADNPLTRDNATVQFQRQQIHPAGEALSNRRRTRHGAGTRHYPPQHVVDFEDSFKATSSITR